MKQIIKQSRLWLAPTVLGAAALLACNDDRITDTQPNTTEPENESPDSAAGCTNPRSADDFLPVSRHVPQC